MKKVKFHTMPQSTLYLFPLLLFFIFASCETDTLIYPEPEPKPEPVDLNFNPKSEKPEKANTFYGAAQQMGEGVSGHLH